MSTLIAIGAVAALFVLFGLVGHRPTCGGSCGGCESACSLKESDHGHA